MGKDKNLKDDLDSNSSKKPQNKKSDKSENNVQKKSDNVNNNQKTKKETQPKEEILLNSPEKTEQKDNTDKKDNIDFDKYLQHIDDEEEIVSNSESSEMEDISSKTGFWQRFADFWKRKDNTGKKILVIVLAILLLLVLTVGGYFISRLSLLGTNADEEPVTVQEDVTYEDVNFSMMNDITDANSLNDLLKEWATNKGEKMSSKNVVNILLLGIDSASNLSDSMILVSLNKSTKKINMVSFYRDSYIYIAPTSGKPRFGKLNAAYATGGAKCVVETIENNYKIKIDEYASVDYNSFPKVISALGGVTVDVKDYEAKYMNREYGFGLKAGTIKLNGEQALKYSRIRHSDNDGDVSRTRRQRTVITSIMNSMKNASLSQIDNMITTLFPNIKTSMSQSQVLSYGTQALTKGWLNFDMVQENMPTTDTSKGGYVGSQWVWIADYPGAAYQLQMLLYGKSNIKLADDRISAIKIKPTTTTRAYSQIATQPQQSTTRSYTTTTTKPVENSTTTTTTKPATTSDQTPSPSNTNPSETTTTTP